MIDTAEARGVYSVFCLWELGGDGWRQHAAVCLDIGGAPMGPVPDFWADLVSGPSNWVEGGGPTACRVVTAWNWNCGPWVDALRSPWLDDAATSDIVDDTDSWTRSLPGGERLRDDTIAAAQHWCGVWSYRRGKEDAREERRRAEVFLKPPLESTP